MTKSLKKHSRLLILFLLLTCWPLITMIRIYFFSRLSDEKPADSAVVLGAAVWRGEPSPVFRERIKHAVDLYQSGQVQYLVFTGGIGFGDQLAEGRVGRDYAHALGVPTDAIFIETTSTTTQMNLQEAANIIKQQKWQRILIVSDPYHMLRAVQIAKDLGLNAHPSPTPTTRFRSTRARVQFLIQETVSCLKYSIERTLN